MYFMTICASMAYRKATCDDLSWKYVLMIVSFAPINLSYRLSQRAHLVLRLQRVCVKVCCIHALIWLWIDWQRCGIGDVMISINGESVETVDDIHKLLGTTWVRRDKMKIAEPGWVVFLLGCRLDLLPTCKPTHWLSSILTNILQSSRYTSLGRNPQSWRESSSQDGGSHWGGCIPAFLSWAAPSAVEIRVSIQVWKMIGDNGSKAKLSTRIATDTINIYYN